MVGWRSAVVVCAFFGALAFAQCTNGPGFSGSPQTAGDAATDAQPDAPWWNPTDAQPIPTTPPPIDAGDPPVVTCGSDAGSDAGEDADAGAPSVYVGPGTGECGFPPSLCADDHWLVYYDYGVCVGSLCQWEKKYLYCSEGCSGGFFGECNTSITAPAGPPR
jgi:hypothetical protein